MKTLGNLLSEFSAASPADDISRALIEFANDHGLSTFGFSGMLMSV